MTEDNAEQGDLHLHMRKNGEKGFFITEGKHPGPGIQYVGPITKENQGSLLRTAPENSVAHRQVIGEDGKSQTVIDAKVGNVMHRDVPAPRVSAAGRVLNGEQE